MCPIKHSLETAPTRAAAAEARRLGRFLAGVFLLLALVLALAAGLYLSRQQAQARAEAHRELSAIADLKLRQLLNWRSERLSDARFFAHARFVARDLQRFLDDPASPAARSDVWQWLSLLKNDQRYYAVLIFDQHLKQRLALPASAAEPEASLQRFLQQALQTGDVVMSDWHRDPPSPLIHIDIALPIFPEAAPPGAAPPAILLLKLDARQFLFPLIQSWPVPSPTAETLLVRREGDDVLYLNDLRHRPATALALHIPLTSPDLPAAKVLRGDTNILEGVDYRGTPVVATGRLIPGTSWAMVAKVDRSEIYAPLRAQWVAVALVLGLLLLAAALFIALLWRQRAAQFLKRELVERQAHEHAMKRMNRLYAALSQVNQAVVHARSRQELLDRMCHVLVQFAGFQMAWLGWLDPATSRVLPLAQCGDDGYLQKIEIFADDRPAGRGPVGTAIREGRPYLCNDIALDPAMHFWREAVAQSGWGALAAFPIRQEGSIAGALTVYSREKNFFGPQEQALLEEAAGDVSFGLDLLLNDQRRQQAEAQSRLQAAALQSAANSIVITDRQGVIQSVNTAFERLTGYTAAEALGQTPRLLSSGRQPASFFKAMWDTILAGQVWQGQLVNKRKDGSLYHEEMTVTPVRDAQSQITHFIAIKQDITERQRAEQAMRASERRMRALFDNAGVGIVEASGADRFIAANPRACQILGRSCEELLRLNVHELTWPEDRELSDRLNALVHSGERDRVTYEKRYLRGDGSPVWVSVTVSAVRDDQGQWMRSITTVEDITERKRAEQAARQARDELAQANAGLERKVQERTAQLLEVNASLEAFVHTAAHDLRSPLRSIKSFSTIVLDKCAAALGPEGQPLLQRVTDSADQMARLLEDLLEYSKLSQAELNLQPVSLHAAVAQVLALLEGDIRAKNAVITVVDPLPEVLGHPATVVMLLTNLVSNALKFMPPGRPPEIRLWAQVVESGELIMDRPTPSGSQSIPTRPTCPTAPTSSIQHPASSIRLCVQDNGIGIAQEDLDKIFAAFHRLHGKAAYPGTGLGLAIVRKGAERMGGRVGVESQPGQGSTFWVELPALAPILSPEIAHTEHLTLD